MDVIEIMDRFVSRIVYYLAFPPRIRKLLVELYECDDYDLYRKLVDECLKKKNMKYLKYKIGLLDERGDRRLFKLFVDNYILVEGNNVVFLKTYGRVKSFDDISKGLIMFKYRILDNKKLYFLLRLFEKDKGLFKENAKWERIENYL